MGQLSIIQYKENIYTASLQADNTVSIHADGIFEQRVTLEGEAINSVRLLKSINSDDLHLFLFSDAGLQIYNITQNKFSGPLQGEVVDYQHIEHRGKIFTLISKNNNECTLFENTRPVICISAHTLTQTSLALDDKGLPVVAIADNQERQIHLYNDNGCFHTMNMAAEDMAFFIKGDEYFFLLKHPSGNRIIRTNTRFRFEHPLHFDIFEPLALFTSKKHFAVFTSATHFKIMSPYTIRNTCDLLPEGVMPDRQQDFSSLVQVGAGTYGDVFRSTLGGEDVAIKVYKGIEDYPYEELQSESKVISQFNHPNIINIIGETFIEQRPSIVMPLAARGSLHHYVLEYGPEDQWPTEYNAIGFGIASAIEYLQKHGVCHGDLTPANIVLTETLTPKLIDFGFAFSFLEGCDYAYTPHATAGTQVYMPPEALTHPDELSGQSSDSSDWSSTHSVLINDDELELHRSTDIFSFGCILYYMSRKMTPWDSHEQFDYYDKVRQGYRKNPMPHTPKTIYQLVMQCYSHEPLSRPSAKMVRRRLEFFCQHPVDEPIGDGSEYISTIDINRYEAKLAALRTAHRKARQHTFLQRTYPFRDGQALAERREERQKRLEVFP